MTTLPDEVIEAECRKLVAIIDEMAVRAIAGLPVDQSAADDTAKRLIAMGFPVTAFVREVMRQRFDYDPDATPKEDEPFIGRGIGELLEGKPRP